MNITRAEAQERARHIVTHGYEVTLDLTGPDETTFLSTSAVRFTSDGTPTWIDLIADRVVEATLDGAPINPALFQDDRLPLDPTSGEHVCTVTALCRYSRTGEGLHRLVDPADQRVYLYSQFEPADARRMYACFEQPDLKATFAITVITPDGWVAVSNSTNPATTSADGKTTWRFPATPPISTYITALVVGEYHVDHGAVRSRQGDVPASLVCRRSMVEHLDVERLRTTTQRGFDVFEAAFGIDFPFDSYDQCFVPEYNAGAMENAGCVTIRDEWLFRSRVTSAEYDSRDNGILHELAHMWFGDLVTMRWWDDLWLNESFAEWASHYCQAELVKQHGGADPWTGFAAGRKSWAFNQDQLPTTHPVAADMVDLDAVRLNFDGITYAKGASVLKQLVGLVGETDFLRGVHEYLTAHAYSNATFDDLLGALQAASGRDLSRFSADWLETCGMNTLRPVITTTSSCGTQDPRSVTEEVSTEPTGSCLRQDDGSQAEQATIAAASVAQAAPPEHPTLRRHHLGVGCFDLVDGKLTRTFAFETDVEGALTELPQLVGRPLPAMLLLNDGDMTFAKVRFDEASLATAKAHVADIDDALARTVTFMALQDMWRDAELPSGDFVDVVLACLADETDMTALRRRLLVGGQAATEYCAPAVRADVQARWADGLRALLDAAAPGSDTQAALADALIEAATPAEADLIAGWLSDERRLSLSKPRSSSTPDGLQIQADQRWAILRSLARLGRADDAAIDAELNLDATQTGLERAAGARAARPTAEAKAAAWQLATATPDVPNETHVQICSAFWQFGQEAVTAEYAPRYRELAEAISSRAGIWASRGDAVAETALTRLWPSPVAGQAFVDETDAWLRANPDLAMPVVKIVRECLDRTRRALRAQAASLKGA